MQQLHLVGFTADNRGLIFSARKGSKSGGFVVTLDDKLIARVDEMIARREAEEADSGASSRPKSSLSPREIQARLRAGRTIAQVAREAGVDEEWVARWAAPILAEQAQVVERAEGLTMEKSRVGPSAVPLGEAVRWNMADKGIVFTDAGWAGSWDAFHLRDNSWMVRFTYQYRRATHQAEWEVDTREATVVSRNRQATELGYVAPGRRRPRMPRSTIAALQSAPVQEVRSAADTPPSGGGSAGRSTGTKKTSAKKTGAKKSGVTKKTAAKKAAAKKAAEKRAAAKKAAEKRAAARKAAAKKAAKKAAAKKSTRRKATSKKTASKKSAAKRTSRGSAANKRSDKRAVAKKSATRPRATARKTTTKKSAAKKAVAKRSTTKKAPARPPAPAPTRRRPRPAAGVPSAPPPVPPSVSSRSTPARPARSTNQPSTSRSGLAASSRASRRPATPARRPEARRPESRRSESRRPESRRLEFRGSETRRSEPRRRESAAESDGATAARTPDRGRRPPRQVEGFPRPATKSPIRIDSGVPRRSESSGPPIIRADRADQSRDTPIAVGPSTTPPASEKQGRFRFRRGRNRT